MQALRSALLGDPAITLDIAALEMAAIEYPALSPDPYIASLDAIATCIGDRLRRSPGGALFVETANRVLFEELGFRGNAEEYYDARNSCLNQVLDRRTGIPITLSVVYIEVARRLRRPVFGIGLPGHFIVQYDDDVYATFMDPFHAGRLLNREDCRQLAKDIAGVDVSDEPALLTPVGNQYILIRMLNNLRTAYFRVQEYGKAIAVLDLLLEASPSSAGHHKARAVAHLHLRQFLAARADFRMYLQCSPEAADREEIAKQLEAIHRWLGSVN